MAVDETKLEVESREAYVWAAFDVDTEELLVIDASYQRASLNDYLYPSKVLGKCRNKPTVLVDGGPRYPRALQRLGLQYIRGGFGARSSVERFFRYLKERATVFYHNIERKKLLPGVDEPEDVLGIILIIL